LRGSRSASSEIARLGKETRASLARSSSAQKPALAPPLPPRRRCASRDFPTLRKAYANSRAFSDLAALESRLAEQGRALHQATRKGDGGAAIQAYMAAEELSAEVLERLKAHAKGG
jgi:hypothetical protein